MKKESLIYDGYDQLKKMVVVYPFGKMNKFFINVNCENKTCKPFALKHELFIQQNTTIISVHSPFYKNNLLRILRLLISKLH